MTTKKIDRDYLYILLINPVAGATENSAKNSEWAWQEFCKDWYNQEITFNEIDVAIHNSSQNFKLEKLIFWEKLAKTANNEKRMNFFLNVLKEESSEIVPYVLINAFDAAVETHLIEILYHHTLRILEVFPRIERMPYLVAMSTMCHNEEISAQLCDQAHEAILQATVYGYADYLKQLSGPLSCCSEALQNKILILLQNDFEQYEDIGNPILLPSLKMIFEAFMSIRQTRFKIITTLLNFCQKMKEQGKIESIKMLLDSSLWTTQCRGCRKDFRSVWLSALEEGADPEFMEYLNTKRVSLNKKEEFFN